MLRNLPNRRTSKSRSLPKAPASLGNAATRLPTSQASRRNDTPSRQLVVSRRRPFFYRPLLRRTLEPVSLQETIRDVLVLIGPGCAIPESARRPQPKPIRVEPGWPELKQFGDLAEDDFVRHPVWINCHVEDYDKPWYDQTDEETFRPWTGPLPVAPSQGMFLVRASAQFHDGSQHTGFLTLAFEEGDLGMRQPHVFVEGKLYDFWGGGPGIPIGWRQKFYEASGKEPQEIFPLTAA